MFELAISYAIFDMSTSKINMRTKRLYFKSFPNQNGKQFTLVLCDCSRGYFRQHQKNFVIRNIIMKWNFVDRNTHFNLLWRMLKSTEVCTNITLIEGIGVLIFFLTKSTKIRMYEYNKNKLNLRHTNFVNKITIIKITDKKACRCHCIFKELF